MAKSVNIEVLDAPKISEVSVDSPVKVFKEPSLEKKVTISKKVFSEPGWKRVQPKMAIVHKAATYSAESPAVVPSELADEWIKGGLADPDPDDPENKKTQDKTEGGK